MRNTESENPDNIAIEDRMKGPNIFEHAILYAILYGKGSGSKKREWK
jgi:hypothetical protein